MVDVSRKPEVFREATATGSIHLRKTTVKRIKENKIEKGDVFTAAKIAGISAAKKTSELLPLCHQLPLTNIDVQIKVKDEFTIVAEVDVKTIAKTGVEMEALVAVTTALLTVWDMTKQYEKDEAGQYPHTVIEEIRVTHKEKREEKH
ncbi:MAG: cyclic pyranopterin monophosphate synthase MoaC [Candidatus Bathyarchaeales archaeon]